HQLIDFSFRSYIDPARRFIEDKYFRFGTKPFAQYYLLLITAAEEGHFLFETGSPNAQLLDITTASLLLFISVDHSPTGKLIDTRQAKVLANRQSQHQALRLSIFGKKSNPAINRFARRSYSSGFPPHVNPSGLDLLHSEDCARQFRAPGAHKSGNTQHLSFMQRKANVAQAARR